MSFAGEGQYIGVSGQEPTAGIASGTRFWNKNTGVETYWNGTAWIGAAQLSGVFQVSGLSGIHTITSGSQISGVLTGTALLGGSLVLASGFSGIAFSGMHTFPTFAQPYKYVIWNSGGTYRAGNTMNGRTEVSGSDFSSVIQTVLDGQSGRGVGILIGRGVYTVQNPISIPKTNARPFIIHGTGDGDRSALESTTLSVGSSFPASGRYVFEHIGTVPEGQAACSRLYLRNMFFANNSNFATVRAGGIRYESDAQTGTENPVTFEKLTFNFITAPIHIIGWVYGGLIRDVEMTTTNDSFSGDFYLRMESDYYGWENASGLASTQTPIHGDTPKLWHIENVRASQMAGTFTKYGFLIEGGYNHFYGLSIDIGAYEAPMLFRGASFSNKVFGMRMQDLNTNPPGDVNIGALVFDSSGVFSGGYALSLASGIYAASSGGQARGCSDNKIYSFKGSRYPVTVAFAGSGYRNFVECEVFGRTFVSVNDLNAGRGNSVLVREGQQIATSGNSPVEYSGGRIRIFDEREGADTRGVFIDSGNASKTVYTIPHRLFANPMTSGFVNVQPGSIQARASGGYDISGDATNIYMTFGAAPASGTVRLLWEANVYPR